MPATICRLILSLALMAGTAVAYVVIFVVLEKPINDAEALLMSDLFCMAMLITGWLAIWRGEVRWNQRRVGLTIASVFMAMVPAALVIGLIVSMLSYDSEEFGTLLGFMVWAVSWIGLTAVVWRETRQERQSRLRGLGIDAVACPTCGYNLTGMKEARCPECGSEFTLDQLYAAQRRDADLVSS